MGANKSLRIETTSEVLELNLERGCITGKRLDPRTDWHPEGIEQPPYCKALRRMRTEWSGAG